jgi:hypothetical protein
MRGMPAWDLDNSCISQQKACSLSVLPRVKVGVQGV